MDTDLSLEQKKLRLEGQLRRLRAAYLGDSPESPQTVIEEIFYDTYRPGNGTSESPAFQVRQDSPLAHIVSFSTAKLVRVYRGDRHVEDVLNSMFLWFSNRERFLKIREEHLLNTLYQWITYNGTKGGAAEINEIFQIEARTVKKTRDQVLREMKRRGILDENLVKKTYMKYFCLDSTDEIGPLLDIPADSEEQDPAERMIESETAERLISLCQEICDAVRRWVEKHGYDYDSFIDNFYSGEKKRRQLAEPIFTRMGAHWTRKSDPLRRELEAILEKYGDLPRNRELRVCMQRFLTARRLITTAIVIALGRTRAEESNV